MNHFDHLTVSLNVVDTKLFRTTIQLEYFFFSDTATKQRPMPIMFSKEIVTSSRRPGITICSPSEKRRIIIELTVSVEGHKETRKATDSGA